MISLCHKGESNFKKAILFSCKFISNKNGLFIKIKLAVFKKLEFWVMVAIF